MNKQRKVLITTTYNELGIIIDTKAEEFTQPERQKGRWVPIDDWPHETWECDQCGYIYEGMPSWTPNYCQNCGADMRGDNAPLADDDSIYG